MKNQIVVLRVDPDRKTVVAVKLIAGRNATQDIKRLCRAKRVGAHELIEFEGTMLTVAGGLDVAEEMTGWKLRGCEDHAGIGVIYGRGMDGMRACPVDAQWVLKRITWLDGEDVEGREKRVAEIIDTLNMGIRISLRDAMPAPDGGMWIPVDHKEHFEAMVTLGLCTLSSRGQKLTSTGILVHDALTGVAA